MHTYSIQKSAFARHLNAQTSCNTIAIVIFVIILMLCTPTLSNALPSDSAIQPESHTPPQWDITIGSGAGIKPSYEGSNHNSTYPFPFFNIVWNDTISLSTDGLNVYWKHDEFSAGCGLTYNGGRQDSDVNSVLGSGDRRLRGMGDIDPALGLKMFASYEFKQFELSTALTKLTGRNNYGMTADVDLSATIQLTRQLILQPHIGATWADKDYMQTFFGVTSKQAARSRFSRFNASAGIKDVAAGLGSSFWLNNNWFLSASVDMNQLMGDAARSPISFSDQQMVFTAMVGYHF